MECRVRRVDRHFTPVDRHSPVYRMLPPVSTPWYPAASTPVPGVPPLPPAHRQGPRLYFRAPNRCTGIRYPFPLREPWPRIIGIPLLGTLLGLIYNDPPYEVWRFLLSIAITGIIWMGDYAIIMAMRRRLPEADRPGNGSC